MSPIRPDATAPTPSEIPPWVCPACRRPLTATESDLQCPRCQAAYPLADKIPLLVPNPTRHLEEMDRRIAENPAWYRNDQIAWYDHGPCRHHLRRRAGWIEQAFLHHFSQAKIDKPRILDLGCGAGANLRWLASLSPDLHGCDYNLLRLRQCGQLMGDAATLCLADILRLPYPDSFFDAILLNQVLEHIPDDERALASARRILRPGGLLVLGVPNEGALFWRVAYRLQPESRRTTDHVHFYTFPEIRTKASAAGFEIVDTLATGYGPPHWKLDERLRRYAWVDSAFEKIGRRCFPSQATSCYMTLKKTACEKTRPAAWLIALYEENMRDKWNHLVDRSPDAWLFHRREFADNALPALNNIECSLVALKNDRMVGVLPLSFHAPTPPASRSLCSLAIASAGPVLDPDLSPREADRIASDLIQRARRLAAEHQCKALLCALPPLAPTQMESPHGTFPIEPLGFSNISTSTYIVDLLPDEQTLHKNLNRLAHRKIRKAIEHGISVRPANRPSDPDRYYDLHTDTYRRTGVTPHPRAYFDAIFHIMAPAGFAQIWAAEKGNETIAYLSVALYKNAAFSWTACSDEEALELGANYLLRWHSMIAAKSAGATHYEVGEAFPGHQGDKLAGLSQFKSAFGGERWPFHRGRIDIPLPPPSRERIALYHLRESLRSLLRSR